MQAIVLAGGLGTRLASIVKDIPKPMAPIRSRPFLEVLLDYLENQGFTDIILSVGHHHKVITDYFGDKYKSINIRYSIESFPLGTGGAIKKSLKLTDEDPIFVLNGDSFLKMNYKSMLKVYHDSSVPLSIALKHCKNTSRYGKVNVDRGRINAFKEKESDEEGLINTGIYLLSPKIFLQYNLPDVFSFEHDFLYPFVNEIRPLPYISDDFFIDIGNPEDYRRAQDEIPF